MKPLTPIALFAFNRPDHLRRTLNALQQNVYAEKSSLFIFIDGAKDDSQAQAVSEVASVAEQVRGFNNVLVSRRSLNLGLAGNIVDGVTEIVRGYGRAIILEDDMVTSPYFLKYMNDALDQYEANDDVISIHGYNYPLKDRMPDTFFLKGADCWGWATWKRGWDLFEADGKKLLVDLESRGLARRFDFNGAYPYMKMLRDQIAGRNNSWAVRWYASALIHDKLTLYPGRSLVQNIGIDNSGFHCGATEAYHGELLQEPVRFDKGPIAESIEALAAFEQYFRSINPSFFRRVLNRFGF